MTDRLDEIKGDLECNNHIWPENVRWLIQEVERLRSEEAWAIHCCNVWREMHGERELELIEVRDKCARDLKEALTTHKAECG